MKKLHKIYLNSEVIFNDVGLAEIRMFKLSELVFFYINATNIKY